MATDWKYDAQVLAEEAAEAKYGEDFYSLPKGTQLELFDESLESYVVGKINHLPPLGE